MPRPPLTAERFWARTQRTATGCLEWTGFLDEKGYGRAYMRFDGLREQRAHRIAFRLVKGPIPVGTEPDHLCRNHACVNPDHLEAVTHQVNCLRGNGASAIAARATHCAQGHPFDAVNTYVWRGLRYCRECRAARARARNRRRAACL